MDTITDKIEELQDQANELFESMISVSATELGLDRRSGYDIRVSDDCIAAKGHSSIQAIEYYGGFEYVKKDYNVQFGDVKFYSNNDDRVEDCISHYRESQEE